MTVDEIRRGFTFIHPHWLDMDWRGEPGQTWKDDAPHVKCVVTYVGHGVVYYGYATDVPASIGCCGREEFIKMVEEGNHG